MLKNSLGASDLQLLMLLGQGRVHNTSHSTWPHCPPVYSLASVPGGNRAKQKLSSWCPVETELGRK